MRRAARPWPLSLRAIGRAHGLFAASPGRAGKQPCGAQFKGRRPSLEGQSKRRQKADAFGHQRPRQRRALAASAVSVRADKGRCEARHGVFGMRSASSKQQNAHLVAAPHRGNASRSGPALYPRGRDWAELAERASRKIRYEGSEV